MYGNGKSLLGAVERLESVACVILLRRNRLASRAHDVWNGAAAGDTADMRGVDIPRLSAFNMVD